MGKDIHYLLPITIYIFQYIVIPPIYIMDNDAVTENSWVLVISTAIITILFCLIQNKLREKIRIFCLIIDYPIYVLLAWFFDPFNRYTIGLEWLVYTILTLITGILAMVLCKIILHIIKRKKCK